MPIVRGGTDAIAIPEAKVQTASLQYRKRVIPGARHVILGPALPISSRGAIAQHQEPP